ncbi:uncharacterized protein LOC126795362 [Argentina anserina]|uniref:uncharacterized protein LOC126795362 n=1 Tax=Argentina anserina TaxID=57926 RepID=UPI0021767D5B|nr:uncharacterized protein LOC126795362 [Potentilla anserina]
MASLVRRLARNPSSIRTHLFPKPKPYPITHHNHLGPPKSDYTLTHLPRLGSVSADKFDLSLPVFPSFPFGYCFDPVLQIGSGQWGLCQDDGVGSEDDAGTMIWADSVKKKRKRKMNKHKLRKLRKSLRRKT